MDAPRLTGTRPRWVCSFSLPPRPGDRPGERAVVYVPVEGENGKFVERPVKLGTLSGDFVQLLEGLKPGDKVVTDGRFFLRAEATRSRPGG